MSVTPERQVAYAVLSEVRKRDGFAPELLDSAIKAQDLRREEIASATRLVYGTLQMQGTLDEAIDERSDSPKRIEEVVRDILRVAAFEILFSRTPAHAAVDQAVAAVRDIRSHASGFANAVLRKLARDGESFPWGDPETDEAVLARLTGHPRWMVDLLLDERGRPGAKGLLEANNTAAPLYLRHNPYRGGLSEGLRRLEADGAKPAPVGLPGCIWAEVASAAVNGAALSEGWFLVSDAASQFATVAVNPRPGDVVVDLCAGRGVKTLMLDFLMAERGGGPSSVVAVDKHAFKLEALLERTGDLGVPPPVTVVADAREVDAAGLGLVSGADLVLVDAPCTGLGTLRRHPEKRWRITERSIAELATLQAELLRSAAALVRPGGAVVYSTCTITRRENEGVVEDFLSSEAGQDFRSVGISDSLPDAWSSWLSGEGWFSSLPTVGGPDGHFVARLERLS